jgi:HK97 family phage portal protein
MGIIASLEQRSAAMTGHPRDPAIAEWFGGGPRSSSGMTVTPDTAMKVTAVYRCVALLSQTYASLPGGVYRKLSNGGLEEDASHPLYDVLFRRPNRWQTPLEWEEMMSGHFALRGRCYSEIISKGGKAVAELIPLHPDRVRPFRAPDGRLAFEYTPPEGPSRVILQDEMQFMHGPALGSDGVTPLSPIGEAREAIGLAMATEQHGSTLFGNATRLGGIVKMPGHLKDNEARKTFLDSFNSAFKGVANSGKTALFEDGMEWQSLGMSNEDAQFIDTRTLQLSEICRIFGVPPHKIYDLGRSTFNNIEHQGIEFVTDTIRPGTIRREQARERDLLSGSSARTHCISYDLDGLMRGDSAARAAFYASAAQNGWKTRDQIRIMEGDNPSGVKGMDEYTVQMNLTTIEKVGIDQLAPRQTA